LDYEGSFSVRLKNKASEGISIKGVSTKGNIIKVAHGRAYQTPGGIQFYAEDIPFYWGYVFIKEIRDSDNQIIWQNYNYKK
jgi:hypothetical protein